MTTIYLIFGIANIEAFDADEYADISLTSVHKYKFKKYSDMRVCIEVLKDSQADYAVMTKDDYKELINNY